MLDDIHTILLRDGHDAVVDWPTRLVEDLEGNLVDLVPLTDREVAVIVYEGANIYLRSLGSQTTEHKAPNGRSFTIKEILDAVAAHESATRRHTEWFGRPDWHHVMFEGLIEQPEPHTYRICWGS